MLQTDHRKCLIGCAQAPNSLLCLLLHPKSLHRPLPSRQLQPRQFRLCLRLRFPPSLRFPNRDLVMTPPSNQPVNPGRLRSGMMPCPGWKALQPRMAQRKMNF
jgi:hypothetical protein